jgi:hypothetical protein
MITTDLLHQATTVPSLDAESALEVLADLWLEEGWTTGQVTAEHHDPALARQKFLGHAFCRAWRELMGPFQPYSMRYRLGGPLNNEDCWVLRPRKGYDWVRSGRTSSAEAT